MAGWTKWKDIDVIEEGIKNCRTIQPLQEVTRSNGLIMIGIGIVIVKEIFAMEAIIKGFDGGLRWDLN